MPASAGRDIAIYTLTDATADPLQFMGIRTSSLDFGAQAVDVTSSSSLGRWKELIAGAGVNSLSFKGQGVFVDDQCYTVAMQAFLFGVIKMYRVIIPKLATIEGIFQITALSIAGTYNGEVTTDITFESSGMPTIQMGSL